MMWDQNVVWCNDGEVKDLYEYTKENFKETIRTFSDRTWTIIFIDGSIYKFVSRKFYLLKMRVGYNANYISASRFKQHYLKLYTNIEDWRDKVYEPD